VVKDGDTVIDVDTFATASIKQGDFSRKTPSFSVFHKALTPLQFHEPHGFVKMGMDVLYETFSKVLTFIKTSVMFVLKNHKVSFLANV